MKNEDNFQEKAIQTAYCWTRYKYYGSEAKAVSSLLNRKSIDGFSREEAERAIQLGIEVLKETEILWRTLRQEMKSSVHQISEEEINSLADNIKARLAKKFPNVFKGVFDYSVGMIVLMPFYR